MISRDLIHAILNQYTLSWNGTHGVSHWARVLENGLRLAQSTAAEIQVIELFAVFHDAKRTNEGEDFDHGRRGADLAAFFRGTMFDIGDQNFELLYTACAFHTDGLTDFDVTIQTCWDADRLDLNRVGIMPEPLYLCTEAAKDPQLIRWANERSTECFLPEFVLTDWGCNLNINSIVSKT